MTIKEIGCCGAYCRTCIAWQRASYPNERTCLGCKLGYGPGGRDLGKAKCKIKVCCLGRGLETCADCPDFPCNILKEFWGKKGWKYGQYRKQLEFIREKGCEEFLKRADMWKRAHGRLNPAE
jgi:hypothetical protein